MSIPAIASGLTPEQKCLTHLRQLSVAAKVLGVAYMLPFLSCLVERLTFLTNDPDCCNVNNFIKLGVLVGPVLLALVLPSTFLSWL